MNMFKVYLAGAISGLTYDDGQEWRTTVRDKLKDTSIECYSPLRQKHILRGAGVLDADKSADAYGTFSPLATDRGIMTRDHYDCQSADLIFVNLLGSKKVSIGTVMEIAWAYAYRKPLVLVTELTGLHDHPMIREATGYRVETLEEGIDVMMAILLPVTEH